MNDRLKAVLSEEELFKDIKYAVERAYEMGLSDAWKEIKAMQKAILQAEEKKGE